MVEIDFLAANHVRIVGLCVRIETRLWVIRFHYVAYVPVILLSI